MLGGLCNESNWLDFGGRSADSLPNISECYRFSALVWAPALYLWLLFPILLFQIWRVRNTRKPLPYTTLLVAKHVITLILLFDSIFLFLKYFDDTAGDSTTNAIYANRRIIYLTYPLINALSMVLMFAAIRICRRNGIITSGILHTSWMVYLVTGVPQIYAWFTSAAADFSARSSGRTAAAGVWLAGVLAQTVLFAFADRRHVDDLAKLAGSPEEDASFLNRQLFWWFNRLPSVGSRNDITVNDLFELSVGSCSRTLVPLWERYWTPVIEAYTARKRRLAAETSTSSLLGSDYGTLANGTEIAEKRKRRAKSSGAYKEPERLEPPSVIYNLFRMFKWEFLGASAIKMFADVLQFANPFLLKLLIEYVSAEGEPLWRGVCLAAMMFLAAEMRSLCISQYFFVMFRMGTKIQTTLTAAVYKKTLRLSNASRQSQTSGEIVNLMAIDVERFQMITSQVQQFWSSPFQIILALIFLFNTLGIAAFPGVIIMAIFVPYSIFGSIFSRRYQMKQMTLKDERTKICSEILNGIKVIKLYAWELPMLEVIERIRKKELLCILKGGLIRNAIDVFNMSSPFLVALCSFTTFTLLDPETNLLTPEIAFVSLTLFNQLRSPMTMIGLLIQQAVQVVVSNKRLKEFLVAEEVDEDAIEYTSKAEDDLPAIEVRDADFSWGYAAKPVDAQKQQLQVAANGIPSRLNANLPTIQDISVEVPRGQLLAVVGRVGCGKSSLLAALLGEMDRLRGRVAVRGRVAYVPQTPWIQNMSVRENITFGRPYNKQLFDSVVDACALRADLEILSHGDATEIGEKGINLSGGQKARVSLARAVYQNCDVYLLDDPLSAVDSHVGKHIFEKVIGPRGLLRNKTRVLVTHGVGFLKEVDRILLLDGRRIFETGTYTELVAMKGKFNELIEEKKIDAESSSSTASAIVDEQMVGGANVDATPPTEAGETIEDYDDLNSSLIDGDESSDQLLKKLTTISTLDLRELRTQRQASIMSSSTRSSQLSPRSKKRNVVVPTDALVPSSTFSNTEKFIGDKLIQKELVNTGRVKAAVYNDYMRSATYKFSLSFLILFCTYQGLQIGRNIWLSSWSDDNDHIAQNTTTGTELGVGARLGVYGMFGLFEAVSFFIALISLLFGGLEASRNLHAPVLKNILRAPMSFFDTTPSGRILNRLGKDIEVIDVTLVMSFRYFVMCITQVFAAIMVITISTPIFAIVIIPLSGLYLFILKYYVPTSRQLRRLESTNRSPIYSHFGETIQGYSTIRAYLKTGEFCSEIERRVDHFIRIKYQSLLANRWLAIRLEFIGNCVVLFAALFGAMSKEWGFVATAGLVGLSVSYSLNITEVLNFAIRQITELETNIVSVERLKEYSAIETEAPWRLSDVVLPDGWPTAGQIKFEHYATRYRPGLELVVRDINAEIDPSEKVGIVGRTGAGKSSLTLALFRMIEPAEGRIVIDDVDISRIGLHDLRSNITIIPQDPVLFSGTLRFNLDPFNRYSDDEIWSVLELAHLKAFADSFANGLNHQISEGGSNISLGQKQLLCLARALLRRSKILVLDEATAAVDLTTDALIQETIRREFLRSTVMTIAHRLNTIIDYDRVLVLERGEIREFDPPQILLSRENSLFAAMAADAKLNEQSS